MSRPLIYHHSNLFDDEITSAATAQFDCRSSLIDLPYVPDVVIGRYSVLPWYQYVEEDVRRLGSRLIHDYATHKYIANCVEWAHDLTGLTPRTWSTIIDARNDHEGSFILKGQTNSRKHQWNTHMFAPTADYLSVILGRLLDDPLISQQGVVIREYMPLRRLDTGINGLPITDEWRVFCWHGQILCAGFYWASHPEIAPDSEPLWVSEFIDDHVLPALPEKIRHAFLVADVAMTTNGTPILIELNDGQMSGLSMCDSTALYRKLRDWLDYLGAT